MIAFPANGELKKLKSFKKSFCVSIYLPLTENVHANRIAVKNALRDAENALVKAGASPRVIRKTLARANVLTKNQKLPPMRGEGLAVFAQANFLRHYHTPAHWAPRLLRVEQGFVLGPLLDAMLDDAKYLLLTLSHNQVSLFEGSHYEIHPIHPKELPINMKEALGVDEYLNWRGMHEIAPAYMGKGSEAYHGQYNVSQTDKTMLVEFFHRLNKRLRRFLRGGHTPLIIGGVDYLLPLYRHANSYPYLLPGSIKGNLERVKLDELRERAWEIVRNMRREHAIN
ncbi:MAG TPA: hypothetical protein VJM32_05670 [Candidatus Saccharimonadales bacterium]|nr:hypothetical protein [Candidatus Saccharimonadales bacterium]